MIVVAVALMGSLNSYAGNKTKTVASEGNYTFRCVGPVLNLSAISFSLPVSRSATAPGLGRGEGSGRLATSTLTIDFTADKAYSTLFSQITHGDHYSSCTLVENVVGSAKADGRESSTVFTWTFSQVTPSSLTVMWRDPSMPGSASAGSPGADSPASLIRATFAFSEVRFEDESGNHTTGAVDNWTQMQ